MNAKLMMVWHNGENCIPFHPRVQCRDTSAWSQRRLWLLVCLWLSIESDSRAVQGLEQTLCEEQTHTKSLTCSWIRTLWVILTSSPLRCAFSAEQEAITPYSRRFSTASESQKMQSVWELVLLFPLPNVGAHMWNDGAGIICTVEAGTDGGCAPVIVATRSNNWTGWFRLQPGNSSAAERQNIYTVTFIYFLFFFWC